MNEHGFMAGRVCFATIVVFAVQGSNMFDNKLNYILYYGTHEKIELKI